MKNNLKVRKDMMIKKINLMKPKDFNSLEYWFDTVKDDRWWDSVFFLGIVRKKIHQMRDNWNKAHYRNSERDEQELKEISKVVDRLYLDNYTDSAYKIIEEKYGEMRMEIDDSIDDCIPVKFTYGGVPEDEITNLKDEIKEELKKADEQKNSDYEKLSQFVLRIEKFWD